MFDNPQDTIYKRLEELANRVAAQEARLLELEQLERLSEGSWVDYSATSTIVGWASFTTKLIYYKTIGKSVFVQFNLQGTSNSTATSFTLGIAQASTFGGLNQLARISDNSGAYTTGLFTMAVSSSIVNCYPSPNGGSWVASGTKVVIGQFWYNRA